MWGLTGERQALCSPRARVCAQHTPIFTFSALLGRASRVELAALHATAVLAPGAAPARLQVISLQLLSALGKSNYGYFMVPRRGPRVSMKAHLSF